MNYLYKSGCLYKIIFIGFTLLTCSCVSKNKARTNNKLAIPILYPFSMGIDGVLSSFRQIRGFTIRNESIISHDKYKICEIIYSIEVNGVKTALDTVVTDSCKRKSIFLSEDFMRQLYVTPIKSVFIVDKIFFLNNENRDSIVDERYLIDDFPVSNSEE